MSYPIKIRENRVNVGAYSLPFSGVGLEFHPLGFDEEEWRPWLHEVGYLAKNSNWNFPSVMGPFWRVYYNLDRGHCLLVDDEIHELLPDRLYLIPAHRFFHCLGQQPVRHFWMSFSLSGRADVLQEVPITLEPKAFEIELIRTLADRISQQKDPVGGVDVYYPAMALLHLLLARAPVAWKPPLPQSLTDLLQFIDTHVHEALPNRRLAAQAHLSIATLCRMFRDHMQTTPAHYVTQIRISRAGHLLDQSELTLDEIAEATGFPNRAYFSRVFKQMTQDSPAAFRKRKQLHRAGFGRG